MSFVECPKNKYIGIVIINNIKYVICDEKFYNSNKINIIEIILLIIMCTLYICILIHNLYCLSEIDEKLSKINKKLSELSKINKKLSYIRKIYTTPTPVAKIIRNRVPFI
jgi:hypothetical protein